MRRPVWNPAAHTGIRRTVLIRSLIRGFRHPIRTLDTWWYEQAPAHRLDRGPMYVCVMIPTWLYSGSILAIGPVPNSAVAEELSEPLQYMLAFAMFAGIGACLVGSLLGSSFFKPKFDIRRSYRIGYSAAPISAAALIAFGWAVVNNTANPTSAFGGLVGPAIGLGLLLNAIGFWLEVRRLDRTMTMIVDIIGAEQQ